VCLGQLSEINQKPRVELVDSRISALLEYIFFKEDFEAKKRARVGQFKEDSNAAQAQSDPEQNPRRRLTLDDSRPLKN